MYYISITNSKLNVELYLAWSPTYKKFAWVSNKYMVCTFITERKANIYANLYGGVVNKIDLLEFFSL